MSNSQRVFLSAEWRDLVMLNYKADPDFLARYVPPGTSLDFFNGSTYVSLVGFRFCRTRLCGRIPVPLHTDFDEVNLRFYVRRQVGSEVRRGVVFIAEIVPRRAIAITARLLYAENYKCSSMAHSIATEGTSKRIEFRWWIHKQWCRLSAQTEGIPAHPRAGSLEQFITEHYWGYSVRRSGGCLEYHVSHEPWQVWSATVGSFEGDATSIYGRELATVLQRHADSAFVADGSPVAVFKGNKIS